MSLLIILLHTSIQSKFGSEHYLGTSLRALLLPLLCYMQFKIWLYPHWTHFGTTEYSRLSGGRLRLNGLADYHYNIIYMQILRVAQERR